MTKKPRRRVPFSELSLEYREELWERLALYVQIKGECTVFERHQSKNGYGRLSIKGVLQAAHRFAYQHMHGVALDDSIEVHHTCYNRACVRVSHLRAVTRSVNAKHRRSHGFNQQKRKRNQ